MPMENPKRKRKDEPLLRGWLIYALDHDVYDELKWDDKVPGQFTIKYSRVEKNKVGKLKLFRLFSDYHVLKGHEKPEDLEDLKIAKRNFRCALRKDSTIKKLESPKSDFTYYKFLNLEAVRADIASRNVDYSRHISCDDDEIPEDPSEDNVDTLPVDPQQSTSDQIYTPPDGENVIVLPLYGSLKSYTETPQLADALHVGNEMVVEEQEEATLNMEWLESYIEIPIMPSEDNQIGFPAQPSSTVTTAMDVQNEDSLFANLVSCGNSPLDLESTLEPPVALDDYLIDDNQEPSNETVDGNSMSPELSDSLDDFFRSMLPAELSM